MSVTMAISDPYTKQGWTKLFSIDIHHCLDRILISLYKASLNKMQPNYNLKSNYLSICTLLV